MDLLQQGVDTMWVLLAAFLVFFMQAGFGMVEAGFIRAKNTCNILTKNFLDFCMASLAFFIFGYALMFGEGNAFWGLKGWFLLGAKSGASVIMRGRPLEEKTILRRLGAKSTNTSQPRASLFLRRIRFASAPKQIEQRQLNSGLIRLSLGLETVDHAMRETMNKRIPLRYYTQSNRLLNDHGIEVLNSVMPS